LQGRASRGFALSKSPEVWSDHPEGWRESLDLLRPGAALEGETMDEHQGDSAPLVRVGDLDIT